MTWRSILSGVLGLALLDAAVSSQAAAGRVGGLLDGMASVISHVLSPTVAAIPDLRQHGGAAPSSSTSSGSVQAQPATDSTSTKSATLPDTWSTSASALYT